MTPHRITWTAVLFALVLHTDNASAHAIGVEVNRSSEAVAVEAYFDDDTPARSASVLVRDVATKSVIAEGRTDKDGRWSFPTPPPGRYEVMVDGGDGHLARTKITIEGDSPREGAPDRVSEGPDREEFTRFPWTNVLLGCGAFAAVGLIAWAARRRKPTSEN